MCENNAPPLSYIIRLRTLSRTIYHRYPLLKGFNKAVHGPRQVAYLFPVSSCIDHRRFVLHATCVRGVFEKESLTRVFVLDFAAFCSHGVRKKKGRVKERVLEVQ